MKDRSARWAIGVVFASVVFLSGYQHLQFRGAANNAHASMLAATNSYEALSERLEDLRLNRREAPQITLIDRPLARIVEIIASKKPATKTELIDLVMWFVNYHSIEAIDAWHNENWNNAELVFSGMVNVHDGDRTQLPHLSCGPRSVAMARILKEFGIKSRQIGMFTDDTANLLGHQVIEVMNPDSGHWETYDPTWNVHYFDRRSGKRVPVVDIVFGDLNFVVPSTSDGLAMGWDTPFMVSFTPYRPLAMSMSYVRRQEYFSAVQYYSFTLSRKQIMLVNENQFDVSKVFNSLERPFRAWADEIYSAPEWIIMKDKPTGAELAALDDASNLPDY